MTTRAKNEISKLNSNYFYNLATMTTSNMSQIPKDPVSAICDLNEKNAMFDEFNALIENNTWKLVPRTKDVNVIRSIFGFFVLIKRNLMVLLRDIKLVL